MRKIAVLASFCVLALVFAFTPAGAADNWGTTLNAPAAASAARAQTEVTLTPPAIMLSSIEELVDSSAFMVSEKSDYVGWKYDGYHFTGNLPPALFFGVELYPKEFPTYRVVFWDTHCATRNKDGACIRVRILLSRRIFKTLDQVKPYFAGVHIKDAQLIYARESYTSYDIVIFE